MPQYEDVYDPPVLDSTFAEKIDELKEAFAPPIPDFVSDAFSVSRAYAVGEYCIYENHFYKFTSAKSAGAWDSTKVQETTLAAEQSSTNASLTKLYKQTNESKIDSHSITGTTAVSYNVTCQHDGYIALLCTTNLSDVTFMARARRGRFGQIFYGTIPAYYGNETLFVLPCSVGDVFGINIKRTTTNSDLTIDTYELY